MITSSYTAKVSTAYGKTLPQAIEFGYEAAEFKDAEEAKNAHKWLTDDEILKVINDGLKNTARQARQVEVLKDAGYEKPTLKTSDLLKLQTLYKVFISIEGTTKEEARAKASANLGGMRWPDEAETTVEAAE